MITAKEVAEVKATKLFNTLLVMRMNVGIYNIYSFKYGKKELRLQGGSPEEVAKFINGFYGYAWR